MSLHSLLLDIESNIEERNIEELRRVLILMREEFQERINFTSSREGPSDCDDHDGDQDGDHGEHSDHADHSDCDDDGADDDDYVDNGNQGDGDNDDDNEQVNDRGNHDNCGDHGNHPDNIHGDHPDHGNHGDCGDDDNSEDINDHSKHGNQSNHDNRSNHDDQSNQDDHSNHDDADCARQRANRENVDLALGIYLSDIMMRLTVDKDIEYIKIFLGVGIDTNRCSDIDGCTILMKACQLGYDRLAECLLDYGASPNRQSFRDKKTALFYAKDLHIAQLLVDYGADVNLADDVGVSLLSHLFTEPSGDGGEKLERLRWLLSHGADVNQSDCHMITPVVLACQQGELLCVQELVEAGADVDIEGYTWKRAIYGDDEDRKIIKSTLSSAIYSDSLELVKFILDKAPTSCVDKWKKDASHLQKAISGHDTSGKYQEGNLDIVRLLVSHDWDWTSNLEVLVYPWLDDGTTFTRTLLHSAALSSVPGMLQYWIALYEGRGLDMDTSEVFTPLHQASTANRPESMQLLLAHGANPGLRDMVGALPVDFVWGLCGMELQDYISQAHHWDHCMSLNSSLVLYRHAYPDYLLADDVCRQMLASRQVFRTNLPVSEAQGWKYCDVALIYSSLLYAVIPDRNCLRTALRTHQTVKIKGYHTAEHEYDLSHCERWPHLMAVTSLKQLARDTARRCMHRHIERKIQTLSCPQLIKDFLNLGDVDCLIQEYRDACDRFTPCPRVH